MSVLWALSHDAFTRAEVLAAHDTEVEAALGWFERHGAVTRRGTDGIHQVDTNGVAVAVFRQHTSRSADPQLHTHALVMAKVTEPSGEWLSLDARFLKAQQRSIGWVYAAALRCELTTRLGVAWGEVTKGHADIVGVPADLLKVFSARSAQVKERLSELVADWTAVHDGAEPDPRTVYRLERQAALDSRPDKHAVGEADALRADWHRQAAEAGVGAIDLPTTAPELPGMAAIDRHGVVAEALARVAAQSSTWLHADLSREIATLLPAGAAASATGLVELVDELTATAAEGCVELQREVPGSKEMETDLSRGDWIDPRLGRTTFGRWAQDYLTTIVHLRAVTRGDYERQLRVHILPVFAEQAVAHITPVDVRRFIAELRATGMAPKTLQKVRLVLRQVLETARSSGAIRANPCDGIRLPRAEAKEPRFLAADEVEALARATRPPYGLVVRFAAATGLRPSELCGLRVGRLNLVKGTVEVAEALTVVAGRTEVGPIKNGVRRTVQITRTLCDQLGLHLAARAATLARPLAADDFVFVAPEGGPLRRDLLHKRIFQPAVEAAGLPAGLRVHDLRHTCASLLIDLGAHPKVIQEWLGHKSITVTIDVYGHLFPSLNEALAERLDEVFRRAAESPERVAPTIAALETSRTPHARP